MIGRETMLWGRPVAPENEAQRSILHCVKMLAPFREARREEEPPSSDLAEGERQFYAFVKGLYVEMYSDPEFFLIPAGAAEEEGPGETAQTDCQQAIQFYAAYLYELGTRAQSMEAGVMALSTADWKEARTAMEWSTLEGRNGPRFERLKAMGLDERQEPGRVLITSREFPKMLYGLRFLCAAEDKGFRYMNYLRLDFEGALRGVPQFEDIFYALSPERAEDVKNLDRAARELGLQRRIRPLREITLGSCWRVDYLKQGREVIGVSAGPASFTLRLCFGDADKVAQVSAALHRQNDDAAAWFDERFPKKLVEGGRERPVRLKGKSWEILWHDGRADILEPTWIDTENGRYVLQAFCETTETTGALPAEKAGTRPDRESSAQRRKES